MALTDKLTAIANAIRSKTGKSGSLTLTQMPDEILSISGGGEGPDLQNDTVAADKMLSGITAHDRTGTAITGNIPTYAALTSTISTKSGVVQIATGYHAGGTVSIDSAEQEKLISGNIKSGVTILGVQGSHSSGTDVSQDTVTADKLLYGYTAHNASGASITGSMPNNGQTSGSISTKAGTVTIPAGYTTGGSVSISSTEQTKIVSGNIKSGVTILGVSGSTNVIDTTASSSAATNANILSGKKAFVNGGSLTGSMTDNGSTSGTISTKAGSVSIPAGYTSGGSVTISTTEQNKIISGNIKSGVTILGVSGSTNVVDTTISSNGATASDIAQGKTAYVNGSLITGTSSGGGGGGWTCATATTTPSAVGSTISFSGLKGTPKAFTIILSATDSSNSTTRHMTSFTWGGGTTCYCVNKRSRSNYAGTATCATSGSSSNFTITASSTALSVKCNSTSTDPRGQWYNAAHTLIYWY